MASCGVDAANSSAKLSLAPFVGIFRLDKRGQILDSARWRQIKSIFEEASELDHEARIHLLSIRCAGDPDLRADVEKFFAHFDEASDFLETTPMPISETNTIPEPIFYAGAVVADRFHIRKLLGRGGMGEVYEATDQKLSDQVVALKTILPRMAWNSRTRDHFFREVRLARQVTHPNVCRVYDIYTHSLYPGADRDHVMEVPFLTMELLRGESLADQFARGKRYDTNEARPILISLLAGLEAAHAAGVVHGDLKPSNIILVKERNNTVRVVITDFGLARIIDENGDGGLAKYSFIAGTPMYMAPEQLTGGEITPAADLFALGLIAHEIITGKPCFPAVRTFDEARRQIGKKPSSLRQIDSRVKPKWDAAVLKCLQPLAKDRYQTAAEVSREFSEEPQLSRRSMILVGSGLALGVLAVRFLPRDTIDLGAALTSIAVLPFDNASHDPQAEYFVAGLTAEVRRSLERLPGTKVTGERSSTSINTASLSYVGVGQRLGTQKIVSGSVRLNPDSVHVLMKVTDAGTGLAILERTFEARGEKTLNLQIEIAAAVAESLKIKPTSAQLKTISLGGTGSSKAFDAYLRGRQEISKRSVAALEAGMTHLMGAITLDPQFALAWATVGEIHERLAGQPGFPLTENMNEAERATFRALEIAPDLPEALLEKGMLEQRYRWRWYDAASTFRKAVAINPNLVEGHRFLSGLLANLGKSEESFREIQIARQLDPLAILVQNNYGAAFYRARMYLRARDELQRVLQMDPNFIGAYPLLADTLGRLGDWSQSVALLRQAIQKFGDEPMLQSGLITALARTGQLDMARTMASDLEVRWSSGLFYPMFITDAYCGLNDEAKVFYWLDVALRERDPGLILLKVDPTYDPYRSDPRLKKLMETIGLETT